MKGATKFCLDWLVADMDGKLITSPSASPEIKYVSEGKHKQVSLKKGEKKEIEW